jgi:valyl-tRNA synthetase
MRVLETVLRLAHPLIPVHHRGAVADRRAACRAQTHDSIMLAAYPRCRAEYKIERQRGQGSGADLASRNLPTPAATCAAR